MRSNEEALRDHFDASNQRDWERAMSHYDEHVVALAPHALFGLVSGAYYGREAVGAFTGDWLRTLRNPQFVNLRVEQGRDALVLQAEHTTALAGDPGAALATPIYYAYWFRAGKIIRVEFHDSIDEARRAAGCG